MIEAATLISCGSFLALAIVSLGFVIGRATADSSLDLMATFQQQFAEYSEAIAETNCALATTPVQVREIADSIRKASNRLEATANDLSEWHQDLYGWTSMSECRPLLADQRASNNHSDYLFSAASAREIHPAMDLESRGVRHPYRQKAKIAPINGHLPEFSSFEVVDCWDISLAWIFHTPIRWAVIAGLVRWRSCVEGRWVLVGRNAPYPSGLGGGF